jgi:hypothetical protein
MTSPIRRLKRHPFYVEWHFEIGIAVLFLGLALVAVGCTWAVISANDANRKIDRQAREGASAHRVQCVQRAQVTDALELNRKFLAMTLAERVAAYGADLGRTPETFVRGNIVGELRVLRAYRRAGLRC